MTAGLWITLIVPAIIAFLFALWVTYSMVTDISTRGQLQVQNNDQGSSGIIVIPGA